MRHAPAAAVFLTSALACGHAEATAPDEGRGIPPAASAGPSERWTLASGRSAVARLARTPSGLERWLPRERGRDEPWALALDAVRAGRHYDATDRFLDEIPVVQRAAAIGRIPPGIARLLVAKARFVSANARALAPVVNETDGPVSPRTVQQRYLQAVAWHNLYLTARAWSGTDEKGLFRAAEQAYSDVFRLVEMRQLPEERLQFAALLADAGQVAAAREELDRIPPEALTAETLGAQAALWAAAGDAERALAALGRARDGLLQWTELRWFARLSNDYDRLRDDPRFASVVGDDE